MTEQTLVSMHTFSVNDKRESVVKWLVLHDLTPIHIDLSDKWTLSPYLEEFFIVDGDSIHHRLCVLKFDCVDHAVNFKKAFGL